MLDLRPAGSDPDTALAADAAAPVRTDIVLLTAGGTFASIIANDLVRRFGPFTIVEEEAECPRLFHRRRQRLLGHGTVLGQRAFELAQRVIWKMSETRRTEIIRTQGLDTARPAACRLIRVPSVNSPECREVLERLAPKAVLVIGTRIIRPATLAVAGAPVINYHAGINPGYRGICGAYWALATGDRESFGATVHLVDQGVDTGGILYTVPAEASARDNITTYPFLLAAAARPAIAAAIEDALDGRLEVRPGGSSSRQWFHPTLWRYVWNGVVHGVW